MSITNPSPNVLINGFSSVNGVDILYTDDFTTFDLEDPAGVNVWVLECIGADEINTPFLDDINSNITYVSGTSRLMDILAIQGAHITALATGTALIFRSTVNNGVDINGNLRDDFTYTFGVYIRTDDTYGIPNNDLRVGATNETTEGDEATGWTAKLDELIRLVGQPILANINYPGIIQLAGDLEGTGLLPRVGHLQGHSFEPHPEVDQVFVAPFGTYDIEWRYIVNANVDANANISSTKLAPGSSGQVMMSNTTPQATWLTINQDISLDGTGAATLAKIRGKNTASSLSSIGAAEDGYALVWDYLNSYWKASPVAGGGGSSVSWSQDLAGSTDITQLVTHISGDVMGGSARGVYLGYDDTLDFILARQLRATGNGGDLYISGGGTSSGTGGDIIIESGGGASGSNAGGDLILSGGRGATNNTGGTTNIVYRNAAGTTYTLASFAKNNITIDSSTYDSAGSLTLNSGSGGLSIYSSNNMGITASSNLVLTTAASAITIDTKTTLDLQINGNQQAQLTTNGLTIGRPDITGGANRILGFTDSDYTLSYTAPLIQQEISTTHQGNPLYVRGQDTIGGAFDAGALLLFGGKSYTGGSDGYVYLGTGNTVRAQISTNGLTLFDLAGAGLGYATIDNTGLIGFSTTANPGGSASGDLSGTYPGPTVAKINGTTISTAGGSLTTGKVLRVTGAATADWGALDLANASAVTGTLPAGNQASQSMGGDVSGTTASATVDKIKGKTLDSGIGTAGAGQDQYSIVWDNGTTSYKLVNIAAGSGVTTVGTFDSQASAANGLVISGTTIYAQSATASNPGMITIAGDIGGTAAAPTVVSLTGTAGVVNTATTTTGITFATTAASGAPQNILLTQENNGSVFTSGTFTIRAQGTAGGGVTGGDLILAGGDAAATDGAVIIKTGANTRLTANASGIITIANLSTGIVHADSSGNLTSSAVDLSTGDVTGTLPTGNQASQSMGGDVSGTTASATVDKIKGKTLDSGIGTAGAGQDQYSIVWDNGTTSYKLANIGAGSGVTTVGTFDSQASAANGLVISGVNIYAQSATSSNPGMIKLAGDIGGTGGSPTVIAITGAAGSVPISNSGNILTWAASTTAPGITQTSTSGGSGATMTIAAQPATGASNNGGGLVLAGGTSGSATAGTVVLKTANTTRLTVGATGVVTVANLGAGVVHADSSGNLTSSAIVNADVDAAAAIAGSKISPAFGAQTITNSSTISVGSTTGNSTIVGGMVFTTRSLSGNLTVDTTTNDNIILVDTSSARTITLPAPSNGRTFIIKDKTGSAETNNITLARNGTEKIEGVAASRTLSTNWGVWRITTDGTDWFFI